MKKAWLTALIAVLALSLSACSGNNASPTESNTVASENAALSGEKAAADKKYTLSEAYFNGDCLMFDSSGAFCGTFSLENGKGEFEREGTVSSAEISVEGDTVTVDIGGEKTVYSSYYIEDIPPEQSSNSVNVHLENESGTVRITAFAPCDEGGAAVETASTVSFEDLEGVWRPVYDDEEALTAHFVVFTEDRAYALIYGHIYISEFSLENGVLTFGEEDEEDSDFVRIDGDKLYIITPPVGEVLVMERYNEENELTADDLQGLFSVYNAEDGAAGSLEISEDWCRLDRNDHYSSLMEFSFDEKGTAIGNDLYDRYLTAVSDELNTRYIYLLNDKKIICLASDIPYDTLTACPLNISAISNAVSAPALPADMQSVSGDWYTVIDDGIVKYSFDSDGTITSYLDGEAGDAGIYTAENGLLTLTDSDDGTCIIAAAVCSGDMLYMGINENIDKEKYFPIEEGQDIEEYFSLLESEYYVTFTREKPVFVNQQDVLGTWVITQSRLHEDCHGYSYYFDEHEALIIFGKDFSVQIDRYDFMSIPVILENGALKAAGELPEDIFFDEYDSSIVYLLGDKIYSTDVVEPYEGERYQPKDITPEMLDGACMEAEDDIYGKLFYFQGDRIFSVCLSGDDIGVPYTLKNNKLTFEIYGEEKTFDCYLTDNYVYLLSENKDSGMAFELTHEN